MTGVPMSNEVKSAVNKTIFTFGNNSTLLHKSNFKVASCEHGIDVISQFHEILARLTH